ncbi:phospholipase [bacterium]|nr:MAG: phospholipase [bacterium]
MKKVYLFLIVLFAAIQSTHAQLNSAQIDSLDAVFMYGTVSNEMGKIGFRMYDSKVNHKRPIIIFLHGSGERGADNKTPLKWGAMDILNHAKRLGEDPILIVPQCPDGRRWVEVDWDLLSHKQPEKPSEPLTLVMHLLDSVLANNPNVDESRVYLTGMSMGGFGTWDWITRNPNLFAAAIPVCGGVDETVLNNVAEMPIWVHHGADDNVVNPIRSRNAVSELRKYDAPVQFTEYVQTNHNSWSPTYSNSNVYKWLFRQRKK